VFHKKEPPIVCREQTSRSKLVVCFPRTNINAVSFFMKHGVSLGLY